MSPTRTYPDGVPSWVDTEQPDPDAAQVFYTRLFGWTFETVSPPGTPMYAIATVDSAKHLKAEVLGVEDTQWTRTALIRDPQGAVFTASQFTPPAG